MTPQLLTVKIQAILGGRSNASDMQKRSVATEYYKLCAQTESQLEHCVALIKAGRDYTALAGRRIVRPARHAQRPALPRNRTVACVLRRRKPARSAALRRRANRACELAVLARNFAKPPSLPRLPQGDAHAQIRGRARGNQNDFENQRLRRRGAARVRKAVQTRRVGKARAARTRRSRRTTSPKRLKYATPSRPKRPRSPTTKSGATPSFTCAPTRRKPSANAAPKSSPSLKNSTSSATSPPQPTS